MYQNSNAGYIHTEPGHPLDLPRQRLPLVITTSLQTVHRTFPSGSHSQPFSVQEHGQAVRGNPRSSSWPRPLNYRPIRRCERHTVHLHTGPEGGAISGPLDGTAGQSELLQFQNQPSEHDDYYHGSTFFSETPSNPST